MVIDTSAVIALLSDEPQAQHFEAAIGNADHLEMSVATALECGLVLERRYGTEGARSFDRLVQEQEIELVPFDVEQLSLARLAFRRFGKCRHPAQLNFGDCFAYALARLRGLPLLFKGDDFAQTDVTSALML